MAAASEVNGGKQSVTFAGPDWPNVATTALLFENVVAVYEKNMRLEMP